MEARIMEQAQPGQSLEQVLAELDFEAWDHLWREAKANTSTH
jgi:hypothetical protein